jgi:hypothetical protein
MNVHAPCLLDQVIEDLRPILADPGLATKARIRMLWATAKKARDLATR